MPHKPTDICRACAAGRHYDCDNRVYFDEPGPCRCDICDSIKMDAENDLIDGGEEFDHES